MISSNLQIPTPLIAAHRIRTGFTLVELLVVLGVILVLATLAVAIVPRAQEKQKVVQTAGQLQGWLLAAKQMAMRDQAPRGLRLNYVYVVAPNGTKSNWVSQLTYIEQPDDWVFVPPSPNPPTVSTIAVTSNANGGITSYTVPLYQGGVTVIPNGIQGGQTTIDFTGGYGASSQQSLWPVAAGMGTGDLIEFNSGGQAQVFPIFGFVLPAAGSTTPVGLVTGPPSNTAVADPRLASTLTSADFRIIRRPRPKIGEAVLQLPTNVVIDLTTNAAGQPYGGSPLPGYPAVSTTSGMVDILFAPSGQVISAGLPSNDIKLWLRDTSEDAPPGTPNLFGGPQFIVTVSARTGMVSVQPVDISSSNGVYTQPYSFTSDGRDTGI